MGLLDKFSRIEVDTDTRISEVDRNVCQAHQKAYENAKETFTYLYEQWEVFVNEQQEIMSKTTDDSYVMERYYRLDGISAKALSNKIEALHQIFVTSIVQYFNEKYHVSVSYDEIRKVFIPSAPEYSWEKSRAEEYHNKMQTMILRYEDILEQIFVQLGGRTFEERALDELKAKCHDFSWNLSRKTPEYIVRGDTIQFEGYGCYCEDWCRRAIWKIHDGMKNVLKALAHFETQQLDYLPKDIAFLVGYDDKCSSSYEFEYEKVKKIRMFKNHRVDIKFASKELANQFAETYLGLVA